MSTYDRLFVNWADRSERSARKVLPEVVELVQPTSVVDVGCGVGSWLAVFGELGVADITGIDGDYVPRDLLRFDESSFQTRDLTQPFDLGRTFDLAVSLEVGEHLAPSAATTYVASLTKLAPVVLFSAAVPGQGGLDHVNEQWPEYWARLFAKHGYEPIDAIRDRVWNDDDVDWWYRQNILFYVSPAASGSFGRVAPDPLRRVAHPQWVADLRRAKDAPPRLNDLVRALPGSVRRFAAYRLSRLRG